MLVLDGTSDFSELMKLVELVAMKLNIVVFRPITKAVNVLLSELKK